MYRFLCSKGDGDNDCGGVDRVRHLVLKINYSVRVASLNVFLGILLAYYKSFNECLPCHLHKFDSGSHPPEPEHRPLQLTCGDEV